MTSAASTANAAVPAPGKLEFKDDYTPEEAERVIRNSKGLPVGVKPKMVWTWPKALLRHFRRRPARRPDSGSWRR